MPVKCFCMCEFQYERGGERMREEEREDRDCPYLPAGMADLL